MEKRQRNASLYYRFTILNTHEIELSSHAGAFTAYLVPSAVNEWGVACPIGVIARHGELTIHPSNARVSVRFARVKDV
mgnify:CR=1 FL=1